MSKDKKKTGKDRKYANVYPSKDHNKGPAITIEDVLKGWEKPIMLCKDFVMLVGGIPIHGSSTGDVDILIRKNRPKDPTEDLALIFRLYRAQPPEIAERLHFNYDRYGMHGPFTSFVPLYDLVLVPSTQRKVIEMSEKEEITFYCTDKKLNLTDFGKTELLISKDKVIRILIPTGAVILNTLLANKARKVIARNISDLSLIHISEPTRPY